MKTKLIVILFLFSFQSNAQKFYYSKGKKVFLSEDTTSISIKGKTKNSYKKIASLLGANSNLVFDTISLKDVAVVGSPFLVQFKSRIIFHFNCVSAIYWA